MDKDLERPADWDDRRKDGMNWGAVSHQQMYDWFAEPRLESMQGSIDTWTEKVAAHFQAAADEVNQALRTAGVHWEGQAAESMQEASTPLAEHALAAKDAATLVGDKTQTQLVQAKWVAATMPKPHPAPAQPTAIDTLPGNLPQHFGDVREQEAAAQEAEERARDLAKTYDSATDGDVAELPTFEVAPKATADVGEPPEKKIEGGDPDPGPGPGPGGPGPGGPGPGGPGPGAGPDPGGAPAPGPGTSIPGPGDTTGSSPDQSGTSGQSATPPAGNSTGVPPGSTQVDTQRPTSAAPGAGLVTGGPGGQPEGSPRGSTGGPGAKGPGSGAGVRGAAPGEGPAAARGGAAGRGAAGMGGGMAPMGAGRGRGDEDTERNSPDYLKDHHDTFWDDTPPVAPPVIGDDDDEE